MWILCLNRLVLTLNVELQIGSFHQSSGKFQRPLHFSSKNTATIRSTPSQIWLCFISSMIALSRAILQMLMVQTKVVLYFYF